MTLDLPDSDWLYVVECLRFAARGHPGAAEVRRAILAQLERSADPKTAQAAVNARYSVVMVKR